MAVGEREDLGRPGFSREAGGEWRGCTVTKVGRQGDREGRLKERWRGGRRGTERKAEIVRDRWIDK